MNNAGLKALEPLIGEWEFTLYNAWFLESMDTKLQGFTTIERLQDSLVVVRSSDADRKPSDIWVIGHSDPQQKYQLFYYDQRGVARIFELTFDGKQLKFWREDKDFFQRVTIDVEADRLHAVAEASDDQGQTWRKDFDMAYARVSR
jgi:hypothetical protein